MTFIVFHAKQVTTVTAQFQLKIQNVLFNLFYNL